MPHLPPLLAGRAALAKMRHFHAAEGLHGEFMETALIVPANPMGGSDGTTLC